MRKEKKFLVYCLLIMFVLSGCGRTVIANHSGVTIKVDDEKKDNETSKNDVTAKTTTPETIPEATTEMTTPPDVPETSTPPETQQNNPQAADNHTDTNVNMTQVNGQTPYGMHGRLTVSGANLLDMNGQIFQMKGVSTHGLSWFPQFVNEETFRQLRDEWNVNVIRLAMYTSEYNGYCTGDENNRNNLKNLIDNGVRYCTNLGMYVIIDWHILSDFNPNIYKNEAIAFFDEMSRKYAGQSNVIFEICNEPNGGTSWSEIKSYAVDVINTIRNNSDAMVIVGTPTWSQDVDVAADSPIDGYNIMYALHFYADTHRDNIRSKLTTAVNKGLPVIVSEFGICDASGNGMVNISEADKWINILNNFNISYIIWNMSNKAETSAIINSWCNKTSGFAYDDYSESGKWFMTK